MMRRRMPGWVIGWFGGLLVGFAVLLILFTLDPTMNGDVAAVVGTGCGALALVGIVIGDKWL